MFLICMCVHISICTHMIFVYKMLIIISIHSKCYLAQLAAVVKYADCISEEG